MKKTNTKWVLMLIGFCFVFQYWILKLLKIVKPVHGFDWRMDLSPMLMLLGEALLVIALIIYLREKKS